MKEIESDNYSIWIGENSLSKLNVSKYSKIGILVDENTKEFCLPLLSKIKKSVIIEIKSGEQNKNIDTCNLIWNQLTKNSFDRDSLLINLGGGIQEILGSYIKDNLNYKPLIICSGAAISYFTKQQAPINNVFDTLYLGWLIRCIFNPKIFIPRYLSAFKLVFNVWSCKIKII